MPELAKRRVGSSWGMEGEEGTWEWAWLETKKSTKASRTLETGQAVVVVVVVMAGVVVLLVVLLVVLVAVMGGSRWWCWCRVRQGRVGSNGNPHGLQGRRVEGSRLQRGRGRSLLVVRWGGRCQD